MLELLGLFEEHYPPKQTVLAQSELCPRRYDPGTGRSVLCHRFGTHRYEPPKTALAGMLSAQHTSDGVASVFTSFQQRVSPPLGESLAGGNGVPPWREAPRLPV